MGDKYLYYDKYLKYKNKYLNLKDQIGGAEWTISKSDKFYNAQSKDGTISVQYSMPGGVEHQLHIMIQSTNKQININLVISYMPHVDIKSQIISKSLIGKELFTENIEFKREFTLAIDYITTKITKKISNIDAIPIIIGEIKQLLNYNI
jgi:hypothetical protein